MGGHVHGAVWMGILMGGAAFIARIFELNTALVLVIAFLPAFVLSCWIGEGTYSLQCRLFERGRGSRDGSSRGCKDGIVR